MHMRFDVITQCGTATRSTRGGSINLVLFVTRFNNARPASRRRECSFEHPRLHGIARNLLYAGFHIPLTSFAAQVSSSRGQFAGRLRVRIRVRARARALNSRGESFALTLAAKLTLALCRRSAKMAKLRRILRHGSQKCLPSIKCLLYKVSTRYFAIS